MALIRSTGRRKSNDPRRHTGLWIVVARPDQLSDLHLLRVHLLQTADETRLAVVWRVQWVSRGPVRRDVWLPADDLPVVGLAAEQIPECGLVLARRRASVGDDVRMESQSALRSVPLVELCLHRRRLRPDFRRLEGTLRGATAAPACHHRRLLPCPAPAICWLRPRHVRVPGAMADLADPRDVPGAGFHVCAARPDRGTRSDPRVR